MPEFPDTSDSLLIQVRDPSDREAWERFEQVYRPVIFRIARAKGLQHSDALDLVQQVLMSVSGAISRYEKRPDGVPFRHWLSRITRHAIVRALSRGPKDKASGGTDVMDLLQEVPCSDPTIDALIETEYRREIYGKAVSVVRLEIAETTWLAFEMTVLQCKSVDQAATSLGISTGSVYAARSRVMRRLRDAVGQIEHEEVRESPNNKGRNNETC
ncbi:MAG: sigma-70 family RNA polymerase sigma factor [Planctomycetota bacterium]